MRAYTLVVKLILAALIVFAARQARASDDAFTGAPPAAAAVQDINNLQADRPGRTKEHAGAFLPAPVKAPREKASDELKKGGERKDAFEKGAARDDEDAALGRPRKAKPAKKSSKSGRPK
jgi:hypothetical protein